MTRLARAARATGVEPRAVMGASSIRAARWPSQDPAGGRVLRSARVPRLEAGPSLRARAARQKQVPRVAPVPRLEAGPSLRARAARQQQVPRAFGARDDRLALA